MTWSKFNKNPPPMQETPEMQLQSLGQADLLEKEMATHSSILAWTIPWTEEPSGLQSTGLQRVRLYSTSLSLSLSTGVGISKEGETRGMGEREGRGKEAKRVQRKKGDTKLYKKRKISCLCSMGWRCFFSTPNVH